MSKAPFYSKNLVRFRDSADSHQYNSFLEKVFYDLTELYNVANSQEDEINRMRQFFEVGSHFTQKQVENLRKEVEELQKQVTQLQSAGQTYTKKMYVSHMRPDSQADESERAIIDLQHEIVTLPYAGFSSSKLYIYDELNKEYIVPNTLKYEIFPEADGVTIKENDLLDALTPDEFKFFHREYTYFSDLKSYADAQIVIELPDNIISSRDVNTIYIHPFPLKTMDILDVEYQLDGAWKRIPGFHPMEEAGNVKFSFSPLEMSKVRISLRQRHFIKKGLKNVFHMGIREIGISYDDYQTTVGRFEIPITFHEKTPTAKTKKILDIRPVFQNETGLSVNQKNTRLLTFKVYEVDDNGKLIYRSNNTRYGSTDEDFIIDDLMSNQIVLKGIMIFDRHTRTTPTLTSVELDYVINS